MHVNINGQFFVNNSKVPMHVSCKPLVDISAPGYAGPYTSMLEDTNISVSGNGDYSIEYVLESGPAGSDGQLAPYSILYNYTTISGTSVTGSSSITDAHDNGCYMVGDIDIDNTNNEIILTLLKTIYSMTRTDAHNALSGVSSDANNPSLCYIAGTDVYTSVTNATGNGLAITDIQEASDTSIQGVLGLSSLHTVINASDFQTGIGYTPREIYDNHLICGVNHASDIDLYPGMTLFSTNPDLAPTGNTPS
jgi:hypothetical protein